MQDIRTRQLSLGGAGMRGVVGPGLTPAAACDFAAAFATLDPQGPVLVGVDPRVSSEMLRCAVVSSLTGSGCEVIDGGVLTAGMMNLLIPHLKAGGGILITGGHQSAGWNALIPLGADGSYFEPLRQRELFDVYHERRFRYVPASAIKPATPLAPAAVDAYWEFLAANLNVEAIAAADLRVVCDFCNGSGAAYATRFAELLGIRLVAVNDSVSGVIPRDPEPRPRSESPIRSIIAPLGAAAGLVFNRDLSRMGVVTDTGEPLSEELTFPLAADYLLERYPKGSRVVTNICSTRALDDIVARHGCILEKSKVGQANVIDLVRALGAVAGGEGSGSFTFGPQRGFDGFLMAGLLLEAIAVRKKPLSGQLQELPRYHIVKQTIPYNSPHAYQQLRQLRLEFGEEVECSDLDGLRFDWPDGFLSLRLSTTDALLRLISESKNPELAAERAWRARLIWERLGI
ncbi:hypothetical protein [Victivallis vadensis]|uniref:hypothetical protein n=1 Tax=Victivallis vadensis TaxID=172901 RepID=UPI0023F6FB23|nr:hypothetical protein [Victivallis vadensis]